VISRKAISRESPRISAIRHAQLFVVATELMRPTTAALTVLIEIPSTARRLIISPAFPRNVKEVQLEWTVRRTKMRRSADANPGKSLTNMFTRGFPFRSHYSSINRQSPMRQACRYFYKKCARGYTRGTKVTLIDSTRGIIPQDGGRCKRERF
jgi:hypothetical protein